MKESVEKGQPECGQEEVGERGGGRGGEEGTPALREEGEKDSTLAVRDEGTPTEQPGKGK